MAGETGARSARHCWHRALMVPAGGVALQGHTVTVMFRPISSCLFSFSFLLCYFLSSIHPFIHSVFPSFLSLSLSFCLLSFFLFFLLFILLCLCLSYLDFWSKKKRRPHHHCHFVDHIDINSQLSDKRYN